MTTARVCCQNTLCNSTPSPGVRIRRARARVRNSLARVRSRKVFRVKRKKIPARRARAHISAFIRTRTRTYAVRTRLPWLRYPTRCRCGRSGPMTRLPRPCCANTATAYTPSRDRYCAVGIVCVVVRFPTVWYARACVVLYQIAPKVRARAVTATQTASERLRCSRRGAGSVGDEQF